MRCAWQNRPSALEMYEELLTLPGLPDPNIDVSPMRYGTWYSAHVRKASNAVVKLVKRVTR